MQHDIKLKNYVDSYSDIDIKQDNRVTDKLVFKTPTRLHRKPSSQGFIKGPMGDDTLFTTTFYIQFMSRPHMSLANTVKTHPRGDLLRVKLIKK